MGKSVDTDKCRISGIDSCLMKPVKQSRLLEAIARILVGENEVDASCVIPAEAKPLQILVAEDNQVNQKVILLQLKKLGYDANAVTNGLAAVESVQKTPYDVVLMDCHMPEMNGYEATRAIRQIAGRVQLIKIIAVTANADPEERKKCLDAGMDDYLIKPIKIEKLKEVLSEIANAVGAVQGAAIVSDAESIAAGLKSFGDVDVIMELIDLFLQDAPEKILEARASINGEGYNGIREAAHSLKGSARNLRAERLADVCELLEQGAQKGFKLSTVEQNLNRVEEELKKVIHVLNNYKKDLAD